MTGIRVAIVVIMINVLITILTWFHANGQSHDPASNMYHGDAVDYAVNSTHQSYLIFWDAVDVMGGES